MLAPGPGRATLRLTSTRTGVAAARPPPARLSLVPLLTQPAALDSADLKPGPRSRGPQPTTAIMADRRGLGASSSALGCDLSGSRGQAAAGVAAELGWGEGGGAAA